MNYLPMSGSNTFDSTLDSSQNMLSKGPFTTYLSASITVTRLQSKTCFKLCEFWSRKQMHCVFESRLWSKIFRKFCDSTDFLLSNSQQATSHLTTSDLWLASCRAVHEIFTIYCFHWTKVAMEAASAELLLILFLFLCNDDEETELMPAAVH